MPRVDQREGLSCTWIDTDLKGFIGVGQLLQYLFQWSIESYKMFQIISEKKNIFNKKTFRGIFHTNFSCIFIITYSLIFLAYKMNPKLFVKTFVYLVM